MANVSFTRDEIILTLDTLYSSEDGRLTKNSPAIVELCELLQTLPVHPPDKRPPNFRNTVGVSDQIRTFRQEASGGQRSKWGVGKKFHEIANEYKDRTDELHKIAMAIRRNRAFFNQCNFGQAEENYGFPEGALLAHLHRLVEIRDSARLPIAERCAICRISIDSIYGCCGNFLEHHLMIPIVELDANKRYNASSFIVACPNCHNALHRYRPWRTKDNMLQVLR